MIRLSSKKGPFYYYERTKIKKTSGTPASIREALKKATTEMLVLFVLRQRPGYTYEMMQSIEQMSDGKITLTPFIRPSTV